MFTFTKLIKHYIEWGGPSWKCALPNALSQIALDTKKYKLGYSVGNSGLPGILLLKQTFENLDSKEQSKDIALSQEPYVEGEMSGLIFVLVFIRQIFWYD